MDTQSLRESATDAIRYWEPRRLVYNAVLIVVVVVCFLVRYPASKSVLSLDSGLFLFLLAVLANVAYCAAYLVDIFAQMSGYRDEWRRYRLGLFLVGLAFASVLTRFWILGILGQPS
jgi:hypothetical protein